MHSCIHSKRRTRGFALAESLIALFVVGLAVAMIGGLAQQISAFMKSGRQAAGVLQMRNRTNAISRDTDSWIMRMRSSPISGEVASGCIHDRNQNTVRFECPPLLSEDDLKNTDPELVKLAAGKFKIATSPVVDLMGEKIAGTTDAPFYLDTDGQKCEKDSPAVNCPLISVGYLLRENPKLDEDPGNVRYVVKVARNPGNPGGNVMKPHYMSVEIGTEWRRPPSNDGVRVPTCAAGMLNLGYLNSNEAYCVNPTQSCATGIPVGLDGTGKPVCQAVPACETGLSPVLSGNNIVCTTTAESPCTTGVFIGFFSGTGNPTCVSPDVSCPAGSVQTGMKAAGDKFTAECVELPPACLGNKRMVLTAENKFTCQDPPIKTTTCDPGYYMTGSNDGEAICARIERDTASTITNNTTNITNGDPTSDDPMVCADGEYMKGVDENGAICERFTPPGDPSANRTLSFSDAGSSGEDPTTCLFTQGTSTQTRSCNSSTRDCRYLTSSTVASLLSSKKKTITGGGTGWYYVDRKTGVPLRACSGGAVVSNYGSENNISVFDPLPSDVTVDTHSITCRSGVTPGSEYECSQLVTDLTDAAGKPKFNDKNQAFTKAPAMEPGLCYIKTVKNRNRVFYVKSVNAQKTKVTSEKQCTEGVRIVANPDE